MRELIRRMSWEPEIFTLCDGLFIQVGGKTVLVRTYGGPRWSVIIRGGDFGKYGLPDVISYEQLSFWQSREVDRLARGFAVRPMVSP
jgi:hypothetical protein